MPVNIYVESGVPERTAARAELLATLERMLHRVLPLLPTEHQDPGQALLGGSRCIRRPRWSTATSPRTT